MLQTESMEFRGSSNIVKGEYDNINKTIKLVFKGNRIYLYKDVPYSVWKSLTQAPSAGQFVNDFMKDFQYERIK